MGSNSDFKGLAHISVFSTDIERSIRFYTENLDFEVTYRTVVEPQGEPDGFFPAKYALLERGSCLIELLQPQDTTRVNAGVNGSVDHFAIEVKNIDRVCTRLKEKGVLDKTAQLAVFPQLFKGMKSFLVRGPSGEVVELLEYL